MVIRLRNELERLELNLNSLKGDKMTKKKLTRSQQLVLDTLNEEALTYEDIAEDTGLSYDGVRGRVSELSKMGYEIERIRDGTNTFLIYKEQSSYRRPLDIKSKISQRIKSIDDFYGITNFLDKLKKEKLRNIKVKPRIEYVKNATLLLSDLHFGEIIYNQDGELIYNTEVANDRMSELPGYIISELKKQKIKKLYILGLGDMVDGDMIYRNHLFRIEKPAIEQVQDVVKSLSTFIKKLVANDIIIEMYNVRGNHGITNYQNLEEDNWDNVVYDMLELVFMDNKDVIINNFKGDEGVVNIGDTKIILSHGGKLSSQIKTSSGLKQFRGLCGKHSLRDGDMIVVGHLHEFGIECDQGKFLIRNGSMIDASEYALKLNLYSEPEQTLIISEIGKTYPVIIPIEFE